MNQYNSPLRLDVDSGVHGQVGSPPGRSAIPWVNLTNLAALTVTDAGKTKPTDRPSQSLQFIEHDFPQIPGE